MTTQNIIGRAYSTTPTATTIACWDANINMSANSFIELSATTATAASTTTLVVDSAQTQFFTGTTTQTVLLPVTSTLALNQSFKIVNNSTGVVTVESSGANTVQVMAAGTTAIFNCISQSGTTAASWSVSYISAGGGGSSPWTAGAGSGSAIGGSDATSVATGQSSLAYGDSTTTASANYAQAYGFQSTSSGQYCWSLGNYCTASGSHAFAMGVGAVSSGGNSFAFGSTVTATYNYSVAWGNTATANNPGSWVIGDQNASPVQDSGNSQWVHTFAGGYRFYSDNTPTLLAQFLATGCDIRGTNTNNSAAARFVGELIYAVVTAGSPVSLTNNTDANVASIALTAGDWDIEGNIAFTPSVAQTGIFAWISTTSASIPSNELRNYISGTLGDCGIQAPFVRLSLSGNQTVYLSARSQFGSGTVTACGGIYARRRR